MFTYQFGEIKIESDSINELKEFVEELRTISNESGIELSNHLNYICYRIEVDYQKYYNLNENNWDIVD